jgi:hypothetical protein
MDFDPYNLRTLTDPSQQYGALIATGHGRDSFRYAKVGAAGISKGKLELCPAPVANHQNLTPVTTQANGGSLALNSKRVQLTLGGTAVVAGVYDQGHAMVNAGTGLGQNFNVLHNDTQASTTGATTIDFDDPIYVALDTTSRVTLVHNPYNGIVEAASKTRVASGVPMVDAAAANFVWVKTRGVMGVLIGSAVTLGSRVTSDGTTAGAVTDNTDVTAPQTEVEVGSADYVAGTTGQFNPIILTID